MEIGRWSSESGERTPPDHAHHEHAPRRVREESSRRFQHPLRGAFVLPCDRVVFARASLDHRLISFVPPGQMHDSRYRSGASALLNDRLRQTEKERAGAYQAPYGFSDATEGY